MRIPRVSRIWREVPVVSIRSRPNLRNGGSLTRVAIIGNGGSHARIWSGRELFLSIPWLEFLECSRKYNLLHERQGLMESTWFAVCFALSTTTSRGHGLVWGLSSIHVSPLPLCHLQVARVEYSEPNICRSHITGISDPRGPLHPISPVAGAMIMPSVTPGNHR